MAEGAEFGIAEEEGDLGQAEIGVPEISEGQIAWISQAITKLTSARTDLRRARCARAAELASQSIRTATELRAYLQSLQESAAENGD